MILVLIILLSKKLKKTFLNRSRSLSNCIKKKSINHGQNLIFINPNINICPIPNMLHINHRLHFVDTKSTLTCADDQLYTK